MMTHVIFAGTKALKKALQLCKDAQQALSMYDLHVMCQSNQYLHRCTGFRYAKAQQQLNFRVRIAIDKGDASDRSTWTSLAVYARGILLQADRVTSQILDHPNAMTAEDEAPLLLEDVSIICHQATALDVLLREVASAKKGSAACSQESSSAGHEECSSANLPRQGTQAGPPSGAWPTATSTPKAAPSRRASSKSPPAERSATAACLPSETSKAAMEHFSPLQLSAMISALEKAAPAGGSSASEDADACRRTAPLPKYLTELPHFQEVALELQTLGLPGFENNHPPDCLLRCEGLLTAPDPAFPPSSIHGSDSAPTDPSLVIWNPVGNSAAWIHSKLHLDRPGLAEMICQYLSAEVLIEDDIDSHSYPHDPRFSHSLLADLNIGSLPISAVSALNDILADHVQADTARQMWDAADPQDETGAKTAEQTPEVWSKRLVYMKQIHADHLLGCVQVRKQPAAGDVVKLFDKLRRSCDGIPRLQDPAGCNGHASQPEISAEHGQLVSEQQPAALPTSQQLPIASGLGHQVQAGDHRSKITTGLKVTGDANGSLAGTNPLRSDATPQQAEGPCQASDGSFKPASEHSKSQSHVRDTPGPTGKSSAIRDVKAAMSPADFELAVKLREAQQHLEAKYRLQGSNKADQEKFSRELLQKEKKADRSRRAWAKIGKEPPPPKQPKSDVKASASEPAAAAAVSGNPSAVNAAASTSERIVPTVLANTDDDEEDEEEDPEAEDQSCDHDESDDDRQEDEVEDDEAKVVRLRAQIAALEQRQKLHQELEEIQIRERMEAQALANAAALMR